jgi:hypothetical protein
MKVINICVLTTYLHAPPSTQPTNKINHKPTYNYSLPQHQQQLPTPPTLYFTNIKTKNLYKNIPIELLPIIASSMLTYGKKKLKFTYNNSIKYINYFLNIFIIVICRISCIRLSVDSATPSTQSFIKIQVTNYINRIWKFRKSLPTRLPLFFQKCDVDTSSVAPCGRRNTYYTTHYRYANRGLTLSHTNVNRDSGTAPIRK